MSKHWTPKEDSFLKEIYENNSKRVILSKIERPWLAICTRARILDLHRNSKIVNEDKKIRGIRSDAWTAEEEDLLSKLYPTCTKEFIWSKIKRPWRGIWTRAHAHGLKRDPEILRQEMIEGGKKRNKLIF
jgi:hypothetical protein